MYRYVFRIKSGGLPSGSIILALVLGLANGIYFWKPIVDPASRHKLAEYDTTDTSDKTENPSD